MDEQENQDPRHAEILARLERRRPAESRYEVRAPIAEGGMGEILEAFDSDLRCALALKRIKPGALAAGEDGGAELLERFFDEAQVTAQLHHPGVVPVHELGVDAEGRAFFTMTRVVGRDLEQVFEDLRAGDAEWTRTRVLRVLTQVCETLAYAHAKGVIHRDLKPANVMVGNFGEVYVMDWGIAKVLGDSHAEGAIDERGRERLERELQQAGRMDTDRLDAATPLATMEGSLLGTPAYMSPEQARGEIEAMDRRSDVYALGAMLYTLLAGHPPYGEKARNAVEIVLAQRAGPPAALEGLVPGLPVELVAICDKAMAREPDERYADTGEMAQDLGAYLEGRVVQAHRTGAWIEFKKWVLRNKALAAASGLALLAVLGGLGGVGLSEKNRRTQVEGKVQELLRLSDVKEMRELEAEAKGLWPPYPDKLDAYAHWLAFANDVLSREDQHREAHARIGELLSEGPSLGQTGGDIDLRKRIQNDAWQHEALEGLLERLDALPDLIADVEERVAFAETVAERTLESPDARRRWRDALVALNASEAYENVELTPQIGLLPIGSDPRSGLLEFVLLQSGEAPERDADGRLTFEPEHGIVFVLLPGGAFRFGSRRPTQEEKQRFDKGDGKTIMPDVPNVDWGSEVDEKPVLEVVLDPFFIGKTEVTQAQWQRLMGANTSQALSGADSVMHPVQNMPRTLADEFVARLGCRLPSEAQWEYSCRGGTSTVYYTGNHPRTLDGHANLADATAEELNQGYLFYKFSSYLDDGFLTTAPVASFEPNPYGLHDVHGNVWEWCLDRYSKRSEFREGDGLRIPGPTNRSGTIRGGSWFVHEATLRASNRKNYGVTSHEGDIGVRILRTLAP